MIYAVTGRPGRGKSYYMVKLAKRFLEKGIDVYSLILINEKNLRLKPRRGKKLGRLFYWSSLEDFQFINDGIVLLDEAGSFFEAREWAKFSLEDRVKFQQHRKMELDIYLGVQSFSRIDTAIRQLTAEVIELNCYPRSNRENRKTPMFFWARTFYPDDIDLKTRKGYNTQIFLFDKQLANAYNHKQFVNLRSVGTGKFLLMSEKIKQMKGGEENGRKDNNSNSSDGQMARTRRKEPTNDQIIDSRPGFIRE
jgi:hypothetical protein